MGDVLNYEVVVSVTEKTSNAANSDLRLVGYENVNAVNWLATEADEPFMLFGEGEQVKLKFRSIEDAFRFRLQFDEAVVHTA